MASTGLTLPAVLLLMPCRSLGARLDSLPVELAEVRGSGLCFGGEARICMQLDGIALECSSSTVRRLICGQLFGHAFCA